jgi:uncharacterized protein YydD (DUF2326 family)
MKLVKLSSTKESFNTIDFNQKGLSIIIGTRNTSSKKNTYNGVGKSLALYLIQFCLGSKSNEKLKAKIPDWTFLLDFTIGDTKYQTERNTSSQSKIKLNSKEYTLDEFSKKMLTLVFDIPEDVTKASFRSLISRFLRTRKSDYISYDQFVLKEQEERALLSNSICLGLQADVVEKKFVLKEEFNKISKLRKAIQSDEIFATVFELENYDDIGVKELEEEVQNLQEKIKQFQIADDYKEIETEVNKFSYSLKSLSNEIALLNETKNNIEKSLEIRSDIEISDVTSLINSINVELGVNLNDRLNDVERFHNKLLTGREDRLKNQLKKVISEIETKKEELNQVSKNYNANLKYLNTFGALDDYVSISQLLADKSSTLDKIKSSIELLDSYKRRESEIKVSLAEQNLQTEEYLQSERDGVLESLMTNFRALTGRFYEDKKGGVRIANNDGDNKLRYKIEAKIQDDSSDGINEVKIFCFDLLLLTMKKNHFVDFIFHDSRLYGNMDTHQRFVALTLAKELGNSNLQYIVSMNQDTIDILKSERTDDEFKSIINDETIVMNLNADSPSKRLLGMHIDLDYE